MTFPCHVDGVDKCDQGIQRADIKELSDEGEAKSIICDVSAGNLVYRQVQ